MASSEAFFLDRRAQATSWFPRVAVVIERGNIGRCRSGLCFCKLYRRRDAPLARNPGVHVADLVANLLVEDMARRQIATSAAPALDGGFAPARDGAEVFRVHPGFVVDDSDRHVCILVNVLTGRRN